ncbi:MAG: HD domain-containing protein [Clostridiales bacterium]|nr:HD domain-containing protein [Clostridiales bacterium]
MNENLEERIQNRTGQLMKANMELESQIEERRRAETAIRYRLEAERMISDISSSLMSGDNFDDILVDALKAISYISDCNRTSLFLLDNSKQHVSSVYEWCAAGSPPLKSDMKKLELSRFSWFSSQLFTNKRLHVEDLESLPAEAENEKSILLKNRFTSFLAYPLMLGTNLSGFVIMGLFKVSSILPREDEALVSVLIRTVGNALFKRQAEAELQQANEDIRAAYDATIAGWAKALELREKETAGHSERSVEMAILLARKLGIDESEMEHIRRGALLHDIGKMVIPDTILQKPGALTEQERSIINEHPVYSRKILGHIDYLAPAFSIPFSHHEKWNGTGYPEGLSGIDIPLPARLFAVVDVWDALSSNRPYHSAMPQEQVIRYLEEQAGSHFDPEIVRAFLEVLNSPDSRPFIPEMLVS